MKKSLSFIFIMCLIIGVVSYAEFKNSDTEPETVIEKPTRIVQPIKPVPTIIPIPKVSENSNNAPNDVSNVQGEEEKPIQKIVTSNVKKNTLDINEAMNDQANFVYAYYPRSIYKVYCRVDRIVDIQFQPGEEILFVGGADSIRWVIDKDVSGTGPNKQTHLFLRPMKEGLSMNLVVTTDKGRTYHLDCYVRNFCTPIINWSYPADERLAIIRSKKAEQEVIPMGESAEMDMTPEKLNFQYKISGRKYAWKPLLAFDDGTKTYIQMPASMQNTEAPALFIKIDRTLSLVNYRVKNNYYIVDRLGDFFEMMVGKEKIKILKTKQ